MLGTGAIHPSLQTKKAGTKESLAYLSSHRWWQRLKVLLAERRHSQRGRTHPVRGHSVLRNGFWILDSLASDWQSIASRYGVQSGSVD